MRPCKDPGPVPNRSSPSWPSPRVGVARTTESALESSYCRPVGFSVPISALPVQKGKSSANAGGLRELWRSGQLALRATPRLPPALTPFVPALIVAAVSLALFPVPAGVAVEGLTLGLLGAMLAVGMALVYRANRILNFAQGELGTAPTVLAV